MNIITQMELKFTYYNIAHKSLDEKDSPKKRFNTDDIVIAEGVVHSHPKQGSDTLILSGVEQAFLQHLPPSGPLQSPSLQASVPFHSFLNPVSVLEILEQLLVCWLLQALIAHLDISILQLLLLFQYNTSTSLADKTLDISLHHIVNKCSNI